jgi:hypothetical protein
MHVGRSLLKRPERGGKREEREIGDRERERERERERR